MLMLIIIAMLRLTSHAIVGEALAELVDHDEEDAERVSAHGHRLGSGSREGRKNTFFLSPRYTLMLDLVR